MSSVWRVCFKHGNTVNRLLLYLGNMIYSEYAHYRQSYNVLLKSVKHVQKAESLGFWALSIVRNSKYLYLSNYIYKNVTASSFETSSLRK
jgi:hypothetical protein